MVEYIVRTDKPERLDELLHLHEIPHYEVRRLEKHGRLVDADRLPVSTRIVYQSNGVEIETLELKYVNLKNLHNAPTVLETSE